MIKKSNINSKLEMTGTDLTIEINSLEYDEYCSATIEYNILLPVLELKKIGLFLEQTVKDTDENNENELTDKKFKIIIGEMPDKIPVLKMIGDDFTLSIKDLKLDTEFNIKISILTDQLTAKKLKEIAEVQKKTWWSPTYYEMKGEEILEIWDRKWSISIEEV